MTAFFLQITQRAGWLLTDLHGLLNVSAGGAAGAAAEAEGDGAGDAETFMIFNAGAGEPAHQQQQLYYWKAPAGLLGNLLNSFGAAIHYFVYFVPRGENINMIVGGGGGQGNAASVADGQTMVPIADVVIQVEEYRISFCCTVAKSGH